MIKSARYIISNEMQRPEMARLLVAWAVLCFRLTTFILGRLTFYMHSHNTTKRFHSRMVGLVAVTVSLGWVYFC